MRKLLIILLSLGCFRAGATHIVGGEMTYKLVGKDTYQVKLKLYIDCFNGDPNAISSDQTSYFSVFSGDSGDLLLNLCQLVPRNSPIRVSKTNYNCIKIAPNACVDAYEYITTMVLPPRPGGYIISFQRCCRNSTILNLVNPLSTGENIWTAIFDTTGIGINSSPEFRNLPPNFLCTNAPLIFDHSAIDPDGDSLVYEFFHPYTGATQGVPRPVYTQFQTPPFDQVIFAPGYSYFDAINSFPTVSLNSKTGLLRITPTLQGQFVVGIVVKEYRKGRLIGYTQRDYQFNVQNCVFETTSAFTTPSVNCNREVFFTNNSQNADSYYWNFGDSTTLADTSTTKIGYYRYPKAGSYWVKLIAKKGNCVDSLSKYVTVYDRINFKLPPDTLLCQKLSLFIRPDSFYWGADYLWNDGSKDTFLRTNTGNNLYWLTVTYGQCSTTDSMVITLDGSHVELVPDSLKCNQQTFDLEATLRVRGDFRTIDWNSDPDVVPKNYHDSLLKISKKGKFFITGSTSTNCTYSDTLDVSDIDRRYVFKTPNVFTPNADGINDVFPERTPSYKYHLIVFDRWGIKVHDEENIPWEAINFATGTYYYFIELEGCGVENKLHGVVQVIR